MREIKFRAWDGEKMTPIFYMGSYLSMNYTGKLMQYTGLKDKNGKCAFSADILKGVSYFYDSCLKETPQLKEDEFLFIIKEDEYSGWVCERIDNSHCFGMQFIKRSEVIGNIYENPELLK